MSVRKKVKLKEITDLITKGTTPSTYGFSFEELGINFIRAEGISKGGYVDTATFLKISEDCQAKLKRSQLKANDILFSIAGMALGKTGIVKEDYLPANTNQAVAIIRPTISEVIPKYLLYHFINPQFYRIVNSVSGQAAQPNINLEQVGSLEITLPSINVQRKIASTLSAYDDLIEINLKRIKLLEELAQRTYEEWFVKFKVNGEQLKVNKDTGLPVGWTKKRLDEVAGINLKSIMKGFEGKIKYVDISSVSTGRIEFFVEYDFGEAPGRAKRIVTHGDIIWSCVRPNRKSYSIIWNPEINLTVSTGFAVITPLDLPSSYLYQFVTTDAFVGYLSNVATGVAYPAVTSQAFEDAEIVVPASILVELFDQKFVPHFEMISNMIRQNQLLKEARDILLPRLMSGEIDVKESEEELMSIAAEPRNKYKTKLSKA